MNEAAEQNSGLRTVSQQDLAATLDAHALWVESGGKQGQRANLGGVELSGRKLRDANLQRTGFRDTGLLEANPGGLNLQGASLRRAGLRDADLRGANLQAADLSGADLRRADLAESKLRGANLVYATLREINLQDADLTGIRGLLAAQLAGANVAGAELPDAVARFEAVDHVEAVASVARPIFLLMLFVCLIAFASITSTTDAALLTNSPSALLPDLSTPIPTAGFYYAAPMLVFALYIYLHLYLEGLWEDIASLPSVFPDGTTLLKKIYPWLLVRLASRFLSDHRGGPKQSISPMRRTINLVFVLLVWWLGPITLFLFWGRYLPRHDWYGTGLHIVLLIVSCGYAGFGLHSYAIFRAIRRKEESHPFSWKTALHDTRTFQGAIPVFFGLLLFGLSLGSIAGIRTDEPDFTDGWTWAPHILALFGGSAFADFRDAEVSTKPENWGGTKEDIARVKGAPLAGMNLRYADASGAFLVKAKLGGADLHGAILTKANLEQADLRGANLRQAELTGTNLRGADMRKAKLMEAELIRADLLEAKLGGASLRGADLTAAKAQKADFSGADLREATLRHAELQGAVLRDADLRNAALGGADLRDTVFANAQLQEADLGAADLSGAILRGAHLQKAKLIETKLKEADLRDAHLQNAVLTNAELQRADLRDAYLQRATLTESNLKGAVLRRADLQGANLRNARMRGVLANGANFQGADLGGARLQEADLRGAVFQGANLSGAELEGAILRFARLQRANLGAAWLQQAKLGGANLQGADLHNASLQAADLRGAKLQNADLSGAKLRGAKLIGADLSDAIGLTQKQLDQACGDDLTKLPDNLTIGPCKE